MRQTLPPDAISGGSYGEFSVAHKTSLRLVGTGQRSSWLPHRGDEEIPLGIGLRNRDICSGPDSWAAPDCHAKAGTKG